MILKRLTLPDYDHHDFSLRAPHENNTTLPAAATAASSERQQPSYKLAYQQSGGFFTDITDEQWKRAQRIHSRVFPNYYVPGNLTEYSNGINDKGNYGKLKRSNWWNGQNFQQEFSCPAAMRIPADSELDGPKWICDPHRLTEKKDCLVYSVGSNGNVMFEKGVKEEIGENCEIHTFDPVTQNRRNGVFSEALKGYATFHPWAFGSEEEAKANPNKVKTLQQTMEELGHMDRSIDLFKIDCEWCEWTSYQSWINAGNLKQILVETHNAPLPNARDFFFSLHDAGYVIFGKEANYPNGAGGVEFAFLKLSTDFFVNSTMYSQRCLSNLSSIC